MTRYNALPRNLWQRSEVLALGEIPYSLPSLYFFLLTSDRPSIVAGLLHLGPGGIADATGWCAATVDAGLDELVGRGLVVRSTRPAHLWVPGALECDRPTPGNQVKGWLDALDHMVDSEPLRAAREALTAAGCGTPGQPADSPRGLGRVFEGSSKGPRTQGQGQGQGQGQKNPPKPPRGRRAASKDESPEAAEVFARWKALQADAGYRRTMKAFPSAWGVQARIDEHGKDEVLAVVEWAHTSRDERAERLREGGYLAATLFRPSKFAEYQGLAAKWKGGASRDWLKEWGGAFRRFVEDVGRGDRPGGRDAFVEWLPNYNRKALPVPDHVLDLVDRKTAA